jgi:hypothetical protein
MSGLPAEQVSGRFAPFARAFNADLPRIVIYLRARSRVAHPFISTFASTSIFTVIVAVFVHFIGHLQTARIWQEQGAAGSAGYFSVVALIFPDLQQFNLADEIVARTAIPLALFLKTIALGGFYVLLYLLLLQPYSRRKS